MKPSVVIEVVMPAMEMDQDTARLVRWLKSEGEFVEKGEPLMEIETDKVTVEIEALGSGILSDVRANPGADIPVGQVVAVLRQDRAELRPPSEPAAAPAPPRATPVAPRIAADNGLDLSSAVGTGPEGAVTATDLSALLQPLEEAPAVSADPEYEARPLPGIKRIAAERLSASYRDAPHFDIGLTVDATSFFVALDRARAAQSGGSALTVTGGLALLVIAALADHPLLNAHFVDGEIRVFRPIHLGVAVALDDGLIVPVIRNAQDKGASALQAELADLTERARRRALAPGEASGSTFTLTNLGMFGIDRFKAIINPPEVGILAVGRARELPMFVDSQVVPRLMLDLTLSADHRALDGATAASFLKRLEALMLEPAPHLPDIALGSRAGTHR